VDLNFGITAVGALICRNPEGNYFVLDRELFGCFLVTALKQ